MQKIVNGVPVQMTQAEIDAHNSRPAPVPFSVTPRQMRLALLQSGLKSQVDSYVAAQPEAVVIQWEYATSVERTNALIAAAATSLGLTQAQVDDLFRLAVTL